MKVEITEETYKDFNNKALVWLDRLQTRELRIRHELEKITGLDLSEIENIAEKEKFLLGNVYLAKDNETSRLISELTRVRDERSYIENSLFDENNTEYDYAELKELAEKRIPVLNEEIELLEQKIANIDKEVDIVNKELEDSKIKHRVYKKRTKKLKKELKKNVKIQRKITKIIRDVNNSYSRTKKADVKKLSYIPTPKNK